MINFNEIGKGLRSISYYLADTFSGSLIILSIYHAFGGNEYYNFGENIINAVNYISKDIYKFSFFLMISWVIGFMVRICVSLIPIQKTKKPDSKFMKLFNTTTDLKIEDHDLIWQFISDEKFKHRKNIINNIMTHHRTLKAAGSAFLISSVFFLISFFSNKYKIADLILFTLCIIFTSICEKGHRKVMGYLSGVYGEYLKIKKEENSNVSKKEVNHGSL